jgi:hypothetical protein
LRRVSLAGTLVAPAALTAAGVPAAARSAVADRTIVLAAASFKATAARLVPLE